MFHAWYHIVIVVDTTLGTADDRIKMYVNGVQETSFRTELIHH
jgi:ethanolamine utilization microcompartment shell protein EutL